MPDPVLAFNNLATDMNLEPTSQIIEGKLTAFQAFI